MPPEKRLPNTAQAKQEAAKPTPEELAQPFRAICILKRMIFDYQSEHVLYARTIDYLKTGLASLEQTSTVDAATAPARGIRSAMRRMSRQVIKMEEKLKVLREGHRRGGRKTGDKRKKRGEETKQKVLAMRQKLIADGRPEREMAGIISLMTNTPSISQVRRILTAAKKARTN